MAILSSTGLRSSLASGELSKALRGIGRTTDSEGKHYGGVCAVWTMQDNLIDRESDLGCFETSASSISLSFSMFLSLFMEETVLQTIVVTAPDAVLSVVFFVGKSTRADAFSKAFWHCPSRHSLSISLSLSLLRASRIPVGAKIFLKQPHH